MNNFNNISENILDVLLGFFKNNLFLIIFGFLAAFYVYGFEITNFTFSFDEELTFNGFNFHNITLGRWGQDILGLVLGRFYYPFTTSVFSILLITISAVLCVSHHETSNNNKLIFVCFTVTSIFYMHLLEFINLVAFATAGIFFAILSYKCFHIFWLTSKKIWLLASFLLLTLSSGIYQSYIFVFFIPLFLDIILEFIEKHTSFSSILKQVLSVFLLFAVAGTTYILITSLLLISFQSEYIESFLKWNKSGLLDSLGGVLTAIYRVFIGIRLYDNPLIFSVVIVMILNIYIAIKYHKSNVFITILLFLSMMFASVGAIISLGGSVPMRALQPVAFFTGAIFYIYYRYSGKFANLLVIVFLFFTLIFNGNYVSKYFLSDYLVTEADKIVATRVLDNIYDVAPDVYRGKYKLALLGGVNHHPRSPILAEVNIFGSSFWQEDNGLPERKIMFLYTLGLPMNVKLVDSVDLEKAKKYAISVDMPVYPSKESAVLYDSIVIVRLSE